MSNAQHPAYLRPCGNLRPCSECDAEEAKHYARQGILFDWSNPTDLVSARFGRVEKVNAGTASPNMRVDFVGGATWYYDTRGLYVGGTATNGKFDQLHRSVVPLEPIATKKFYLVWTNKVGANNPSLKHLSFTSASVEAERLSRVYRNQTFHVVEVQKGVTTPADIKPPPPAPKHVRFT